MKKKLFLFLIIVCGLCNYTLAQSEIVIVRQYERLLSEWKAEGYNTGSEKYASLMVLMSSDCQMADRCAKGYINQFNASSYDISAATWLQYIKTNQIGIELRDLQVKQDDDGRNVVFCWIKYTQPGSRDKADFVGFKFSHNKISYLYTDDNERTKRLRSSTISQQPTQPPTQQVVRRTQRVTTDTIADVNHTYVNLGLPSGTLWASCNIGANNPYEYGDYFAWGETATKTSYNWASYSFSKEATDKLTKYCTKAQFGSNGFNDSKIAIERSDDVASVKWGLPWHIPTIDQMQELKDYCTWTWTIRSGKNGYLITGRNGNSIFLPATGCRQNSNLNNAGLLGFYWTSSLNVSVPQKAFYLHFGSGGVKSENGDYFRFYGFAVRPVRL